MGSAENRKMALFWSYPIQIVWSDQAGIVILSYPLDSHEQPRPSIWYSKNSKHELHFISYFIFIPSAQYRVLLTIYSTNTICQANRQIVLQNKYIGERLRLNTEAQKDRKVLFHIGSYNGLYVISSVFEKFCRDNYFIHLLTSLRLVSVTYYYPYFSDEEIGSPSAAFSSTALLFFNTTGNLMDVL